MAQQAPHSEIPSRTISRGDVSATQNGDKSRHAVTIDRAPEEVYRFWRNFENLALFMKDVKEIISETPVLSQWKVELKSGRRIEWTAEITTEVPGKLISWSSLPDEPVQTSGTVSFEPATGGRGTVVRLSMDYAVPGGRLTEWAAFLTGEDPDTLAITNLKRFKQVFETGECATTEGQPSGREEQSSYVLKH